MSVLEASIKCASIGFAVGFLAQSVPNLGSDIWQLAGLLAFTAVVFLIFEFSNLEPDGRNSQLERVDARGSGKWERGLTRE